MTTRITTENITDATIGTADIASSVPLNTQWQSVFTGDGSTGLTAVAGRGYFIDTTSGTVTVTLPASPSAGDVVVLKDYARTWGTNAVSLASAKFDGIAAQTPFFSTSGQTVTLVYMDGTKGWSLINEDTTTGLGAAFITATGGTVTESGDYKIHTFTGDGCFVVSCAGAGPAEGTDVDYLVVAGGGGGAGDGAGGGGAGGYREGYSSPFTPYTASPLVASSGITVSATTYPVVVGAGGGGGPPNTDGSNGSNSVFSTITSAGGGGGGRSPANGLDGGSGGGPRGCAVTAGAGNTPPVNPPQGTPGGTNPSSTPGSAGGGGATDPGSAGSGPAAGPGGDGGTTSITASPVTYAGGGGGGNDQTSPGGTGGPGGGGNGARRCGPSATAGTANSGGGGGGAGASQSGAAGGKGIVIIRYKFQ